jgi:carboxyl-terminal processing protease
VASFEDEQFEAYLKRFRPLTAGPLPFAKPGGARRHWSWRAAWTAAAAAAAMAAAALSLHVYMGRRQPVQPTAKAVSTERLASAPPMTIRSANAPPATTPNLPNPQEAKKSPTDEHPDTEKGRETAAPQPALAAVEQPVPAVEQPAPAAAAPLAREWPGNARLTKERPTGLTLARDLSPQERRENFEALWSLIDAYNAKFALKSIDWNEVGRRYRARLETLTGDDDFYLMMFQLVNETKDTGWHLENYKVPMLDGIPDVPIDMVQGKPFIVGGAKAGWEVLSVDGMTAAEKMESMRPYFRAYSSERAFRRQAGRSLLAGRLGTSARVELRSPEGQRESLVLRRGSRQVRLPARKAAIQLTRQRFVHFGVAPPGLGYIQIEPSDDREEITQEFDHALEALRDTPGLVLDIRDNGGGLGYAEIAGRYLQERTLVGFSYVRNGPRHQDLARREDYLRPRGEWQYTRPVALLVNDLTGGASDWLASELRSAGRVVTLGTTTHGDLSVANDYTVLPCRLVVRVARGYVTDAKDQPIEGNGNIPDITVDPDIQDYLNGRDPVLERAMEVLLPAK